MPVLSHSRTRGQIRSLARSLRDALGLNSAVTVDMEDTITKLGGVIRLGSAGGDAGMIERVGTGFTMHVPSRLDPAEDRWSLAHLTGHLFLHQHYLLDDTRWEELPPYRDSVYYRWGHQQEEFEADTFAAAFLVGDALLRSQARRHRHGRQYWIEPLARCFGVPRSGLLRAGRDSGLFAWDDPAVNALIA